MAKKRSKEPTKHEQAEQALLERQWAGVDYWRGRLRRTDVEGAAERLKAEGFAAVWDDDEDEAPDNPALAQLRVQWESARAAAHGGKTTVDVDAWQQHERTLFRNRSILNAISAFVEVGLFPPPEYLLALHDLLTAYFAGDGHVELEETVYGPRKQRVGNAAARAAQEAKVRLEATAVLAEQRENGGTLLAAATRYVQAMNPGADEDFARTRGETIAREIRKIAAASRGE